jgi:hypothetical protein
MAMQKESGTSWFIKGQKISKGLLVSSILPKKRKKKFDFGVFACLFWQIGGHSSRFVLLCYFLRLFTIKMIKSVEVFFEK